MRFASGTDRDSLILARPDLDNMTGSTVDSMSEAVDNAAVMLSCISLGYKESANCRLVNRTKWSLFCNSKSRNIAMAVVAASAAHQQGVPMHLYRSVSMVMSRELT
eukprot:SAG31_NODE_3867_length_3800_cov_23.537422_2_plen_106_part_00